MVKKGQVDSRRDMVGLKTVSDTGVSSLTVNSRPSKEASGTSKVTQQGYQVRMRVIVIQSPKTFSFQQPQRR